MPSKFQIILVKIRTWIRRRKNPVMFACVEMNGKKYVVITYFHASFTGVKVKWQRRFEFITECDGQFEPIPTKTHIVDL